ncbi:MAG: hypothetical protein IT262_08340, partial [Saprospiraceae bacterium]|nr:hypothetical protein [Saprospiraceae bacterium]
AAARVRNEHALIAWKEAGEGTGIALIDKSLNRRTETPAGRNARDVKTPTQDWGIDAKLAKHNLSWDLLFGDADFCECGECTSVYSAASYFVELLQYLRNNNLDLNPANDGSIQIKSDPKDISNTPLEKLFARRPDLGCLELTCKNTNTILPYVDLVNEVMENYVVFKHTKPFNVADETSAELLAQPQHTEYQAYCILKDEVYPFTLPYHQPIDAARIDLAFLGTNRSELIDVFRSPRKPTNNPDPMDNCDPADPDADSGNVSADQTLDQLHKNYIDRAVDAEYLGITQEEYVILTKEAFVSKEYWDKQCNLEHTQEEYRTKIGVRPVHQYYGYETEVDMLDDQLEMGLTFVKKQFLRRTGIQYTDLVELLLTRCLNPNMPRGRAKYITENIHFSYRFLQQFKAVNGEDKLIELLTNSEKLVQLFPDLVSLPTFFNLNGNKADLACPSSGEEETPVSAADIKNWVKCHFEKIGRMIVLENGGKCACTGGVFRSEMPAGVNSSGAVLQITTNCELVLSQLGEQIVLGQYNCSTGEVIITNDEFIKLDQLKQLFRFTGTNGIEGYWEGDKLLNTQTKMPYKTYLQAKETCNLDTVRLIHLDGSSVTVEEYDHIHRFIRLWRKMGWTIDEIDKALTGLSAAKGNCLDDALPGSKDCDDCGDLFDGGGDCADCGADCGCGNGTEGHAVHCDITPYFLHQLVAVKKLLDKTGLELIKLLTFWTNISTSGEKSLYKRLFLTHNLLGMDKVFKADQNGNFLASDAKISEHVPVLMAAFNLSADDLEAIMEDAGLDDALTVKNLSVMYRYRLLSKALGLKIPAFISILPLFGNPFTNADTTLEMMERWGRMEDAGFDYRQLNYLIRDVDDPKKPLAPTEKTVLQLAKKLYDGLNAIEVAHQDLKADPGTPDADLQLLEIQAQATTDLVRSKAAVLFDPPVVEQIAGILEGTNVFITNAPKNLAWVLADDKSLKKKIKYDKTGGSVQITSILTDAEKIDFTALSNDVEWTKSLIRIEKQQNKLFKAVLYNVFEAEKVRSPEREPAIAAAEAIIKA